MLPLWLHHRAVCINNTQKPPEKGGFQRVGKGVNIEN